MKEEFIYLVGYFTSWQKFVAEYATKDPQKAFDRAERAFNEDREGRFAVYKVNVGGEDSGRHSSSWHQEHYFGKDGK